MKRPIIIFGTGRSGSTLFAQIMSCADEVVYPSQITSKLPRLLFLSRLYLRFSKTRIFGRLARRMIRISEAYPFWNSICPEFVEPKEDMTEELAKALDIERIRGAMEKLAIRSESRLLFKITGWPRMGFLREVFPDAIYVHVIRDGRAVSNSLIKSNFWDGHLGPDKWRLGRLPEKQRTIYENSDKSQIALAGVYWNTLMERAMYDIEKYSPELLEIRYEELCREPIKFTREAFAFCGLKWDKRKVDELNSMNIRSMNAKWQKVLSKRQIDTLESVTGEVNEQLGYSGGSRT